MPDARMDWPAILTIIGTGIALAAFFHTSLDPLREDIRGLREDVGGLRQDVGGIGERVAAIEQQVASLDYLVKEHRQQHSSTLAGGVGGSSGDGKPSLLHEEILLQNANKPNLGQKTHPDTVDE